MIKKRVCNGIRILAGNRVEKRQLQGLDFRKAVQSLVFEAFAQALPVAIMNRHGYHLTK